MKVLAHAYAPFAKDLREEFLALNTAGVNEIHRAALTGNALAQAYAHVVNMLLAESGCQAAQIQAIGAHGQTVRHRPQEFDGTGYTSQINNPALLAELTGIDVVADFRSRDVAAGGEGAPLVPAFHQAVFGQADQAVAVLNIGGISNVTLLPPQSALNSQDLLGFDCGPGNALMDYWCQKHTGQAFDSGGQWAASGQVIPDLLTRLLNEPYFTKTPPKSTGRDLFNPAWLEARLTGFSGLKPVDIITTLTELTSNACTVSVASYGINSKSLLVCGGGALNNHLMARLKARLPGVRVESTECHGLPPLQVEAAAFAWLARKCAQRETGSLQKVTGARGARILGGIYAA
jgi:anhydro-N-acetylmuramic acid kinase